MDHPPGVIVEDEAGAAAEPRLELLKGVELDHDAARLQIAGEPSRLEEPPAGPRPEEPDLGVIIEPGRDRGRALGEGGHALRVDVSVLFTYSGLGQGTFAIALLMMNLRSRTTYGSGVLSGFSQGLGYAGAAIVPLLFGIVKDATGGWSASFAMLAGCILVMLTGAFMINGPRKIEDGKNGPSPASELERVL